MKTSFRKIKKQNSKTNLKCCWVDMGSFYETGCCEAIALSEIYIHENVKELIKSGVKYCCYCGGKIVEG